jgi:amino acid transporter
MKLISSNCCMALAISGYLQQITVQSPVVQLLAWTTCYLFFTGLHVLGGVMSIHFQSAIVLMCLLIIFIYFFAASVTFDFNENAIGERGWFVNGFFGFASGFPFGIWFMDGFEELPLAIGIAEDPGKSIPKALKYGAMTALFIALGLIFLGSSSTDPYLLMDAAAPLMITFNDVWGDHWFVVFVLDVAIILGLSVSFSSFVLLLGKIIQVQSVDGLLPRRLGETHSYFGTPVNATIFSSTLGFLITSAFGLSFGEDKAEDVLITISLFAAVTCYFFNFLSLYAILNAEEIVQLDKQAAKTIEAEPKAKIEDGTKSPVAEANAHAKLLSALQMHDPGEVRFVLGKRGVQLGIFLCMVIITCILYLFTTRKAYHIGIFIIASFTTLALIATYTWHCLADNFCLTAALQTSANGKGESSIDDSTRSTTPLT